MKKQLYAIVIAFIAALTISSCTDENIRPQDGSDSTDPCQYGCK